MREIHRRQFQLGQTPVDKIRIDPRSRDDIPAVLKGLQHIWSDEALRERLFALLDEHVLPDTDRTVGRPGMDLWQILVLAVLKQGLGCDFDRLHDLANHHGKIREFLGHSDFAGRTRYEYQTVVDNVSLLTPELLSAVGQLVVESGHRVAKKKPGEPLRGRCDSFVVETDVHYPTDVSLLWDAMRCLLRETGRAGEQYAVGNWRQCVADRLDLIIFGPVSSGFIGSPQMRVGRLSWRSSGRRCAGNAGGLRSRPGAFT